MYHTTCIRICTIPGADTGFFLTTAKKKLTFIYAHNANCVILPGRERLRHVRYMNKCFYWSHDNAFKKLSL